MIKLISILSLYFFIGGCCTFRVTNEQCECKKVYREVNKYKKKHIDLSGNFGQVYLYNPQNKPWREYVKDITDYIIKHQNCWVGLPKQFFIDLLGEPFKTKKQREENQKKLFFSINVQPADYERIRKGDDNRFYVKVFYKENLNDPIEQSDIDKIVSQIQTTLHLSKPKI